MNTPNYPPPSGPYGGPPRGPQGGQGPQQGGPYGQPGGPYGRRKKRDFFVKHLLGVDAPGREIGEVL